MAFADNSYVFFCWIVSSDGVPAIILRDFIEMKPTFENVANDGLIKITI